MDTADPIQTLWKAFEQRCLPVEATQAQRDSMQYAFFSGAKGMCTLTTAFQEKVQDLTDDERAKAADRFADKVFGSFESYAKKLKEKE